MSAVFLSDVPTLPSPPNPSHPSVTHPLPLRVLFVVGGVSAPGGGATVGVEGFGEAVGGCGGSREGKVVGRKRQRGLAQWSLSLAGREERDAPSCHPCPHSCLSRVTATPRWGREGGGGGEKKRGVKRQTHAVQRRRARALSASSQANCPLPLPHTRPPPSPPAHRCRVAAHTQRREGWAAGVGGRGGANRWRRSPCFPPCEKHAVEALPQLLCRPLSHTTLCHSVHSPHEDVHGLFLGAAALWGGKGKRGGGRAVSTRPHRMRTNPPHHTAPRRAPCSSHTLPPPPQRVPCHSRHRPGTSPTP